jgi:hypothetical protein
MPYAVGWTKEVVGRAPDVRIWGPFQDREVAERFRRRLMAIEAAEHSQVHQRAKTYVAELCLP